MKRLIDWAARIAVGVAVLLAVVVGGLWIASEAVIGRTHDVAGTPLPPGMVAAASEQRGRHLAQVFGCTGCHGGDLRGELFFDEANVAVLHATNLTRLAAGRSDAVLERAVRHGVAHDGRGLWIMPSSAFADMRDEDLAAILAYLRSLPPGGPERPRLRALALARIGMVTGRFADEAVTLRRRGPAAPPDAGAIHAEGRYLAAMACAECHGPTLGGGGALDAPDLAVAAAYEPEAFRRLMRTGRAAGDREVGLMSEMSRTRFVHFTDAEIDQLHGYLRARAAAER